jgi:hypothetical protein
MHGRRKPTDPGRSCPLTYRYDSHELGDVPEIASETLSVVGGLFGNVAALDEIARTAGAEPGEGTLGFNGEFNWFNARANDFRAVDEQVLAHAAIQGNVEAELPALFRGAAWGARLAAVVPKATGQPDPFVPDFKG